MGRNTKVVAAAVGVLAIGVSGALVFRKESPEAIQTLDDAPQELLILKLATGPHFLTEARPPAFSAQPTSPPMPLPADPPAAAAPATETALAPLASISPLERADPVPPPIALSYPEPQPDMSAAAWGDLAETSVYADAGPDASEWTAARAPRLHKIIDGDTLPALATRYLGDAERYLEIYEANRAVLDSPDVLPIGTELTIPRGRAGSPVAESSAPLVPICPSAGHDTSLGAM
jgi:nucleoid-associated protein YgaU